MAFFSNPAELRSQTTNQVSTIISTKVTMIFVPTFELSLLPYKYPLLYFNTCIVFYTTTGSAIQITQ